jgi:hypothetical protein
VSIAMLSKDVSWIATYSPEQYASHRPNAQLRFEDKDDAGVFFAYTFGTGVCAFRQSVVGCGTGTGWLIAGDERCGQRLGLVTPDRCRVVGHWVFLHNADKVTMVDLVEAVVLELQASREGQAGARRLPDGQWYVVTKERRLYLVEHERPAEPAAATTACKV